MRAANALLSILLLVLSFDAAAKTVTVRGEGYASCASWIQEHDRKSSRQRQCWYTWKWGDVSTAAASRADVRTFGALSLHAPS